MIRFEQIQKVYSGKVNTCCCGCAGNHSDNPVQIKRTLNKINKHFAKTVLDPQSNISVELGSRLYIAYFKVMQTPVYFVS